MTGKIIIEWVLYLRKSKGRAGISRQRTTTTAHIEAAGGRIVAEFADTDATAFAKDGQRPPRPRFDAMLAMLRANPGVGVAAWHADRLTRNDEDRAELARICRAGGHPIETRSGGRYDLSTANGRKRFRDDASDAEYEVDHMTERILAMKAEHAAEGRWLGGRRPFGWLIDKDAPGGLVLEPAEAAAVAQGDADVLDRKTLYAVARTWNAAGLTTSAGKPWRATEVRRVLLREMNAAPPPAKWPALVDAGTHRMVAAVLADPRRKTTPGPERRHLLSGLVLCSACGRGMMCSSVGPARGGRPVYRCRAGLQGEAGHVIRDAAALDAYVTMVVIERFHMPDARTLLLKQAESALPRLREERGQLEDAMKASNDLRRRGLLTPAEFADERTGHQEQLARLDGQIADAERADVLAPMVRDPAAVWKSRDLGQRRAIIAELMTITVHPQKKGRPAGWQPGQPYFDPDSVAIERKR